MRHLLLTIRGVLRGLEESLSLGPCGARLNLGIIHTSTRRALLDKVCVVVLWEWDIAPARATVDAAVVETVREGQVRLGWVQLLRAVEENVAFTLGRPVLASDGPIRFAVRVPPPN
jgi:hypothetical protein